MCHLLELGFEPRNQSSYSILPYIRIVLQRWSFYGGFDLMKYIDYQDDEIYFYNNSNQFCVCYVDIINSTDILSKVDDSIKLRRYYSIFLNTVATTAKEFNAKIIKNIGDGLIYYFPETSDPSSDLAFHKVMDCCFMMINSHRAINLKTHDEHLPEITYRISADYGRVEVARSLSSFNDDLFGTTMNICARMNHLAYAKGFVIGSGLYQLVKQLQFPKTCHTFKRAGNLRIGVNKTYPIYHVIC